MRGSALDGGKLWLQWLASNAGMATRLACDHLVEGGSRVRLGGFLRLFDFFHLDGDFVRFSYALLGVGGHAGTGGGMRRRLGVRGGGG